MRIGLRNQTELARLTPAQRQYVKDNYGELLDSGAQLGVCKPGGNGGEPVLSLRTGELKNRLEADPSLHFRVQTHYHGDIHADNPVFYDKNTICDAMKRAWDKDPLTMFVLPQTTVFGAAKNKPIGDQFGHTAWNNVKDEVETVDEALHEAGLDPARVDERTVSGHSSGGYPLARIMASTADDPQHPRIEADHVLVLDTVRGALGDPSVPQWWLAHHPHTVTYVDATMHAWTPAEAQSYGWEFLKAQDHFDAVKSFLDYRSSAHRADR